MRVATKARKVKLVLVISMWVKSWTKVVISAFLTPLVVGKHLFRSLDIKSAACALHCFSVSFNKKMIQESDLFGNYMFNV